MAKILIAEDKPDNAEMLRHFLARQGHDVKVTTDGSEAVAAHAQASYGLIILDAAMPEMDGFGAAKEMRERDRATPILMITAHKDALTRAHANRVGIDHVIYKPYDPADVSEAVNYLLRFGRLGK